MKSHLSSGAPLMAAFFVLACAPVLLGQRGRASISGTITDTTGAVIPNATVTVTNTDNGFTVSTSTSDIGSYVLPLLPVGTYTVRVRKEGFKTEEQEGIVLTADQAASVNLRLPVGAVTDEIKVLANAEMLTTNGGTLSQVIQEKTILELPLNGRNPASLVLLTPGMVNVLSTGGGVLQSYTTFPTETGASANGGREGSTTYTLDGAMNMDNYHLLAAPFPNADATQEFRVAGNNAEAGFGFTPGAAVSIVTKSGTNVWRGDVFEFLRNGDLNARNFFSPTRDELKRNQFGASIGGPIVKDKLFIFGNYQGTTERRKVGGTITYVPSDAMLQGDFSGFVKAGVVVKDPDTGLPAPNGFISPTRFSPAALKIAASLPRTTDPIGTVNVTGFTSVQNYNEFTTKTDYYLSAKHRISGRTFFNDFAQPEQTHSLLNSDRSWLARWQNHSGNYTWTIAPTVLNNVVASYSRLYTNSISGLRDKDGKRICYSQLIEVADPPNSPCTIESLSVNGAFGFGQNYNGLHRWTWSVNDSVTVNKGRHLIVAGVDVMRQYWDLATDWLALPIISFDGSVTGVGLSDFLVGRVAGYTQGGGEYQRLHATQFGAYVQDQIKLKPNFTMSVGLRWEPFFAPVPASGRMVVWSPGSKSQRYPNAPAGMLFPGDPGVPAAGTPSGLDYYNPRLGLAWQPSFLKHTSIRAAFGIATAPVDYSSWNHTADTAPFSTTYSLAQSDPAIKRIDFDRPWANFQPTGGKSPFPPFPTPGASPPASTSFVLPVFFQGGFNRNFRLARDQSWNLSIERQFATNWLVRAAYVGSETYHLVNGIDRNPGIFAAGNARSNRNFTQVLEMASWATSNYQSGQFTIEKRFSQGFQFQSNYTFSKALDSASIGTLAFTGSVLDPFNMRNNRGWSAFYFPHILVTNFVWELPKLKGWNSLVRGVLGDWQLSGIWSARSGSPLGISGGNGNRSGTGTGQRADYATSQPDLMVRQGSESQWLNRYFNTAAFKVSTPGTLGNTPRALIHGPPVNSWDMGISKNWRYQERYRLQFRWEMFNALNHPNFGNPNTNPSSVNFGRITSGGNPRVMQGALKLYF